MPIRNAPNSTVEDLTFWLDVFYHYADNATKEILSFYSQDGATATPYELAAIIYTDSQYVCPTQDSAVWTDMAGEDTFVYLPNPNPNPNPDWIL